MMINCNLPLYVVFDVYGILIMIECKYFAKMWRNLAVCAVLNVHSAHAHLKYLLNVSVCFLELKI